MPNVQEQVVSSDDTLKMKMAMGRKLLALQSVRFLNRSPRNLNLKLMKMGS